MPELFNASGQHPLDSRHHRGAVEPFGNETIVALGQVVPSNASVLGKDPWNSLTLISFLLFLVSFGLHAYGGSIKFSAEQVVHGGSPVSMLGYLTTSQFWFESFQN